MDDARAVKICNGDEVSVKFKRLKILAFEESKGKIDSYLRYAKLKQWSNMSLAMG